MLRQKPVSHPFGMHDWVRIITIFSACRENIRAFEAKTLALHLIHHPFLLPLH